MSGQPVQTFANRAERRRWKPRHPEKDGVEEAPPRPWSDVLSGLCNHRLRIWFQIGEGAECRFVARDQACADRPGDGHIHRTKAGQIW